MLSLGKHKISHDKTVSGKKSLQTLKFNNFYVGIYFESYKKKVMLLF